MAVVVLCSTTSFTIDKHYCGKILVDVAINKGAKKCAMEQFLETSGNQITKPSCCTDEHLVFLGQDELKKNIDLDVQIYATFPASVISKDVVFRIESQRYVPLGNHDPPERDIPLHILYESFLI